MKHVCLTLLAPLLFGACALDETDPELSTTESDLSAIQWQAPEAMNLESREHPSLVYWNNRLVMAGVTINAYRREAYIATFNGSTWSAPEFTDGWSHLDIHSNVALAVLNGELYDAVPRDRVLQIERYQPATKTWSTVALIEGYKNDPSMTVLNGKLYVSYDEVQNGADRVVVDRIDGSTITRIWSKLLPQDVYAPTTALAAWSGQLHLLWSDGPAWETPHRMHEMTMVPGSYTVVNDVPMNSWGAISMTVCNGTVHMIHRGDSDSQQLWWSYRPATSTGTWSTNVKLNQLSSFGAGIGCNAYVVPTMVHDNQTWTAPNLKYSEFQ